MLPLRAGFIKTTLAIVGATGIAFGVTTSAAAQVSAVAFPIPGHIESATSGHFIDLTLAVAKEASLQLDLQILPPPRAIGLFMQGKSQLLFPSLDVYFPPDKKFIRSKGSFNCKEDFVFTKKGANAYDTLESLSGKRVGITTGYPYVKEVTTRKDIVYEEATSDEANVEKLMKGRIDAFILEKESGWRAFKKVNALENMQVDLKKPVSRQDVYWAFQDNPDGQALASKFDAALTRLQQDKKGFARFNREVISPTGCLS